MLSPLLLSLALAQPQNPNPGPVLKLEPQIQAQPGQVFVVKAENNLAWKRWTIPGGLTRVPPDVTKFGEDAFVGFGPAGVYEFRVEGTFHDQHAEAKCIVFVGSPAPLPPGPGPQPGPAPPSDVLVAALQSAFVADGRRADIRDRLCRLWLDAAADVTENTERATLLDFRKAIHDASANYPYRLQANDLIKARELMGEELKQICNGTETCPLGTAKSEIRLKIKALLERYATALAQVK